MRSLSSSPNHVVLMGTIVRSSTDRVSTSSLRPTGLLSLLVTILFVKNLVIGKLVRESHQRIASPRKQDVDTILNTFFDLSQFLDGGCLSLHSLELDLNTLDHGPIG